MSLWSAGSFLARVSLRNRVRKALLRLREPRYLVGTALAALYLFGFLGRAMAPQPHTDLRWIPVDVLPFVDAALFGVAVLGLGAVWLFGTRPPLLFTEAEIQLLFPAPVTRRNLLDYKVVTGLCRIALGTGVTALLLSRTGFASWWRLWLGLWLTFGTVWLHLIGAGLTRIALLEHGRAGLRRRLGTLVGVAVLVFLLAQVAVHTVPPPSRPDLDALAGYLARVLATAPLGWLVLPVRAIVRVVLATDALDAGKGLAIALATLAAHYLWVVRSDRAFEESALESASRRARIREARAYGRRAPLRGRNLSRAWFPLASQGRPAVAIIWKNAVACQRLFLLPLVVVAASFLLPVSALVLDWVPKVSGSDLTFAVAVLVGTGALLIAPIGPLVLRADLRQDVKQLDILRAFPLRGWQVVLAELLGPALLLALLEVSLVATSLALSAASVSSVSWGLRLATGATVVFICPMLSAAVLLVQNAGVVLFPAWVAYEPGQRGIEAIGQRLLNVLGTMLVLGVGLAPSAGVGAVIYFLLRWVGLPVLGLPVAALVCGVLLAGEVGVGVVLAGKAFDTLDVSVG